MYSLIAQLTFAKVRKLPIDFYKRFCEISRNGKVVEATRIAKEMAPELTLDGEFQFDAAFVPSVAEKKLQVLQLKVMLTYSYSQA